MAWSGTEPAWAITGLTDGTVTQGLAGIAAAAGFHQGHILNSLLEQNSQWFQGWIVQMLAQFVVFFLLTCGIILNSH